MDINLYIENGDPSHTALTGGAWALTTVDIHIDRSFPPEMWKGLLIHEVIEVLLPTVSHDKIEEVSEVLTDALERLENEMRDLR